MTASGRSRSCVIEVPVEANVPVRKGDVLMRIDPAPYQAVVDRLEAALAEAEQAVPQLKAAWDEAIAARQQAQAERTLAELELGRVAELFKRDAATQNEMDRAVARNDSASGALERTEAAEERARLAYESEIGGVNTTVAQIQAQLDAAIIDLAECTLHAPADGYVTQLFVQPGAVTLTATFSSVMSFVYAGDVVLAAQFPTNALRHMQVDDAAEVVFDTVPGAVFSARVGAIIPATGSGALSPDGSLDTTASLTDSDLVLVRIEVDDERFDQATVPVGTGGTVGVYTDGAKAIRIIRKVVLRIQAWLNYL